MSSGETYLSSLDHGLAPPAVLPVHRGHHHLVGGAGRQGGDQVALLLLVRGVVHVSQVCRLDVQITAVGGPPRYVVAGDAIFTFPTK